MREDQSHISLEELAAALLEASGFRNMGAVKKGVMKLIDASCVDGSVIRFWLKKGWPYKPNSTAIQFGNAGKETAKDIPDKAFLNTVWNGVDSAKNAGAAYALMVQPGGDSIWNWAVLPIESVYDAYEEQLAGWPARARNGSLPTLYFVDERNLEAAQCVRVVQSRTVSLNSLAMRECAPVDLLPEVKVESEKTYVQREVDVRLKQRLFHKRVGEAYGWRCAVSNCAVRRVLEAAHLPGRSWREHNRAQDGILLRADIHKLLDAGLARLENGIFLLDAEIEKSEYGQYHGTRIRTIASVN